MINSRAELLFQNLPDKYPRELERNYPHILNRLMQTWNRPEFDPYLHDLTVDMRGSRHGFSPEVIAELMFLGELHDIFARGGFYLPEIPDSWHSIPVHDPTPEGFYHALEHGQLDVIETFLRWGVNPDYRFEGAQTPLMVAAISGQLEIVRYLIKHDVGVNLHDGGAYTALHWAASYGHSQIVAALLDAGAGIDVMQHNGDTPLALAVIHKQGDVAKQLLERGADPNIASRDGSPLAIALAKKNQGMVSLLQQFGARA